MADSPRPTRDRLARRLEILEGPSLALLYRELRDGERRARFLLRFSRRLEAAQRYEDAMAAALDAVRATLGYRNVWVYLLADDRRSARLLTVRGTKSLTVEEEYATLRIDGDRFLEELRDTRDHLVIEDARSDPRTDKRIVERLGNRTIINVAITLLDRRLGFLGTGTFGDEGVRPPEPRQLPGRAIATSIILGDRLKTPSGRSLKSGTAGGLVPRGSAADFPQSLGKS